MKGKSLNAVLLLLALALVCIMSAPAFSVEDPWDVDDEGEGGNGTAGDGQPDTSIVIIEGPPPLHQDNPTNGPVWYETFWQLLKAHILGSTTTTVQPESNPGGGNATAR